MDKIYAVSVTIRESQSAENPDEAQGKFIDNFMFSDLMYGEWKIVEVGSHIDALTEEEVTDE